MPGSGERRVGAGSKLFAIYAVSSLVPVLVLGLILFRGYRHEALDRALGQGRAQAAVIEEMAIAPVLGHHDLDRGLTGSERQSLLDATQLSIFSGSIVRLRVRSFGGRVIFSDDGSATGAPSTAGAAFRAAAGGGRHAALVADPSGGSGEVIRVLEPITPNASGQSTGVLEVYLPYAAIAAKVQGQLHRTTVRLAGALAVLYLVLALVAWSTTQRLRRHAAEREHEALHDPLTALPNRELFRIRAERATRGAEQGDHGAVVLVDLDRFKEVNDTLGHHAGDELLKITARRLRASLRTDDTVARLGGDEFGLVLPGVRDAAHALELLGRCRDELAAELTLESVELGVEASFGIALYPAHGTTVEALLKRADAAMYEGKRGAASVVVFEAAAAPQGTPWLVVQGELRHALERDELLLHYQPKLDLPSGRISGVEALLRWQHPEPGLLLPGAFLPAAEQSGLIDPLTVWVLRRALEDLGRWTACGVGWPVSVNISARNLESPQFAELVMGLLDEAGVAVEQLCLELTETAIAADATLAARALGALAERCVAVSMDDFGTGYTSLSGLRTLPVAEVKIDRAFVIGLDRFEQDRSIVRSIIELGHGLGCSVTAEGVETAETAAWLRAAACDSAQGHHFARPARGRTCSRTSHRRPGHRDSPPPRPERHRAMRFPDRRHLIASLAAAAALAAGASACGGGQVRVAERTAPAATYDRALHDALPANVRARGVLRVVTDASYAPASAFAPDGRTIVGFEPDLAAALGRVLGVRLEFTSIDFSKVLPRVRSHRADLVMSAMTDTAERERSADFVNYLSAGTAIVVRRGNPDGISDLGGLCGRTVAVEKGTVQVDLLARAQRSCQGGPIVVRTYGTNADALLRLRTGQASAVLNDYPPAAYLTTDPHTRSQYQLASTTQYEPGVYGIAVAKDRPALRDALRAALERLMDSGAYTDVLRRWSVAAGAVRTASVNAASATGGE